MENNTVNNYLVMKAEFFKSEMIPVIKRKILEMDEDSFVMLQACQLKDPIITLVLSLFLGSLGIDRFFIGDIGMGLLKLFTFGGCGVITIYDWITIFGRTKDKNYEKISTFF